MKKILFLLLSSAALTASATIVKIGTPGYVTVDGQNYSRAGFSTYYQYRANDTTLQLSLPGAGQIAGQTYIHFLDGDNSNTPFTSMAAVITWMNAHGEPTGNGISQSTLDDSCEAIRADAGGGGTPADPTASIQYNNAGAFGADADFFWDGTALNIRANGIAATKTAVVVFQNTVAATSGVANQYPPSPKFLGTTYNNTTSVTTGWWFNFTSTRQSANVRPAFSIDATLDNSTWTPILSFTPYAATPLTTLNVGGFTITSGNFTATAGNITVNSGYNLTCNGASFLQTGQTVFASLPAANSSFGKVITITDAGNDTLGAVVTGGGSFLVMLWSNGIDWTIIGK